MITTLHRSLLLALLALIVAPAAAATAAETDTAHYHIVTVGERADADAAEFGRMLEQAYPIYRAHFDNREPKLGRNEKLQVYFADTLADFQAEMKRHNLPELSSGGYYAPDNKVAYLWRQPQDYDTRALVMHECAHQFHFLACCNNKNPGVAWYVEGVADYLSNHLWDGEHLVAPANPWVTPKDNTRVALSSFAAGHVTVETLVADKAGSYPERWAFYRWLALGDDGKVWRRFSRIARQIDAGGWNEDVFIRTVCGGRGAAGAQKIQEQFLAWLRNDQQPMQQVWCFWQHIADGKIIVRSPTVGLCPLKQPAARLCATVDPPAEGAWKAGLIVSFADAKNFRIAYVDSAANKLRVHRYEDGSWVIEQTLDLAARPPSTPVKIEATRLADAPGKLQVRVNGHNVVQLDEPDGARLGLMVDGCNARFSDVQWWDTLPPADDEADGDGERKKK
ncbi:MAG: hypothetical protein AB7K09_13390 [Planctomycetota bacterium]